MNPDTTNDDEITRREKGPFSYENWKAAIEGIPSTRASEYPLFSDAHIVGNHIFDGLGPYHIMNSVALPEVRHIQPSLVLRVTYHGDFKVPDMSQTDDSRYHGGDLPDEIASIISLCLGIRLKSGGASRVFEAGKDNRGVPISYESVRDPVLPKVSDSPVLPQALASKNFSDLLMLKTYPSLCPDDANVLIRSVRMYQEALWIAESTPELSWIMLVSAVETVANRWRAQSETPIERLRASRPELEQVLLAKGDDAFVESVAEQIAPYMGATRKFIDFTQAFLPAPPSERPPEFSQHSWTKKAMERTLGKIYSYRSRALHGGQPFPAPMCFAPPSHGGQRIPNPMLQVSLARGAAYEEVPSGRASGVLGGVWLTEDTPILLHLFEYIVRNAILNWWKSLI